MLKTADIIVIGAGIAGTSLAAELADKASVILLEMEAQPGYHATGRSAAFFAPAYGNRIVRGITAASEHFYRSPPQDFTDVALFRSRDCFFIARSDQLACMQQLQSEYPALQVVSPASAIARIPILSTDYLAAVVADRQGGDLDVDAILQGYLRMFRKRGGKLSTNQQVLTLQRRGTSWDVGCRQESFSAKVVVNAAGAWADNIAELAGVEKLGITPLRRTALLIDAPPDCDISDWPMVLDVDEKFYFKPEAGRLLISPADETVSVACDVQPEELDVALAIDRFETVTGLEVARVNHRWAGLRTFAPDKTFVVGFDPRSDGFFWLAGQGGYGVQSAPAMAQLSMSLLLGSELSGDFAGVKAFVNDVAPERLIRT